MARKHHHYIPDIFINFERLYGTDEGYITLNYILVSFRISAPNIEASCLVLHH